ncbi:DUF1778 domain-containing protein [Mesorhizobium sp. AR02]|uniref:DUF1778 domain-containing protein n=1 Tax=Mesorhizobium sp. AR02 TaxID=2865837 RepID=UPI00215F13E1|nr:DUF1778 domain-containing protein [Mesorhizobium sp. AR02]UVK53363.1 DUF1778 domain-containing protein [Mesorhizobium sp. AR02]
MAKDKISSTRGKKPKREAQTDANNEEHQQLNLSTKDRRVFVEALINRQPVNDRLRDTVRRYRQAIGV